MRCGGQAVLVRASNSAIPPVPLTKVKTMALKLKRLILMSEKFIALICARTSTGCPIKREFGGGLPQTLASILH